MAEKEKTHACLFRKLLFTHSTRWAFGSEDGVSSKVEGGVSSDVDGGVDGGGAAGEINCCFVSSQVQVEVRGGIESCSPALISNGFRSTHCGHFETIEIQPLASSLSPQASLGQVAC